jgi:asparagine synthase (glutamine-hydrolysing)
MDSYFRIFPRIFREKIVAPLIMKLPDQPQKKGAINILKRFIEGSLYPVEAGAMRWQYFLRPDIEENIFSDSSAGNISFDPFDPIYYFSRNCNSDNPIDKDIYVDIKLTMADSVLMKVDKMSMATSLEVRVPFLDHEVAELSMSIPSSLKLKGTMTKYIFRKALKKNQFLPDSIIYRGKQGYSLPVKNWLREDLKDYMIDLFASSPVIRENFNSQYISQLIDEHVSMKHNHNHILWGLMNVGLWYKRFF